MDGTGALAGEGVQVLGGAVAFVTAEAVVGVEVVEGEHHAVAGDFGDDGGGGDGKGEGVAVDDAVMREGHFGKSEGVDEGVLGGGSEGGEGARHGEAAGGGDAQGVDPVGGKGADADGEGFGADALGEGFALGGGQDLAIVDLGEPGEAGPRREDDGGSDDGAGEGAAPDFVDAGDEAKALPPEGPLVGEGRPRGHRRSCLL